jgi:signal transduction histidine kinase
MAVDWSCGSDASRSDLEPVGATSDVCVARPSHRPEPSPISYAVHDAKNMVGVLTANVQFLRRTLGNMRLPRGAAEALEDMDQSSGRLDGLLREALAALNGHTPQPTPPPRMRAAPFVAAVVDRMLPGARARDIQITVAGSDEVCATIEPKLLERVIVNLLENALRFSRVGDTIEVGFAMQNGRMTLAIGDRGPGVPEAARDDIFESYRHRDPDGEEAHFGLGLAFCREVARAHGGDAWVFNRAGGGACFVFETA